MKTFLFAAMAAVFTTNAFANEGDSLLSIERVMLDGTVIDLPTLQKADGTVCTSYLSEIHRENNRSVATVKEYCSASPTGPH